MPVSLTIRCLVCKRAATAEAPMEFAFFDAEVRQRRAHEFFSPEEAVLFTDHMHFECYAFATSGDTDYVTPACMSCRKETKLKINGAQREKYMNGALLQDAFPNLTRDQRELIKSGTHAACWDFIFGVEE